MTSVKVKNIEVVQAIQNAVNHPYVTSSCSTTVTTGGVPLIAKKTTYVRVYFENFDPADQISVEGTLKVDPGAVSVPSQAVLRHYEGPSPGLMEQRLDWNLSLNFKLPGSVVATAETKTFELDTLRNAETGELITVVPPDEDISVEFEPENVLTCRVLIFRYRDVKNNAYIEPTREEVNTIRNYIERSFPVSQVVWNVLRVEAQREFYAIDQATHYEREHDETATRMLAKLLHQIMAHRNQEIKEDAFPTDTYYIGVYSDPRGRFGSVAVDAPPLPLPHIVAACATDSTGEDGAHEIAHALGRSHPGIPLLEVHGRAIGQYRIDEYALDQMGIHGYLSPPDRMAEDTMYIGLDTNRYNHTPTVLAPTKCFDLMSYRSPRWPSAYTYRELYKRLSCTESEGDFDCDENDCWTVICSFDINRKDGQILSVLPTNYRSPEKPVSDPSLEHFYVRRAGEQLYYQLDRLQKNDIPNLPFWKSFLILVPKYLPFSSPFKPANVSEPKYTVSNYNQLLETFIDSQVEEKKQAKLEKWENDEDKPKDKIKREALAEAQSRSEVYALLNGNNIATELYEPDIRIFPNYSDDPCKKKENCSEEGDDEDDGDDDSADEVAEAEDSEEGSDEGDDSDGDAKICCFEQDLDHMWENGIKVYYRRIGSKDRFPFGLLQATVTKEPETEKAPKSITLLIDKIVVDKYAYSLVDEDTENEKDEAEEVAQAIFDLTDCIFGDDDGGDGGSDDAGDCMLSSLNPLKCEDRPSSNSLVYDIRKDAYYLNFHWPMAVFRQVPFNGEDATITTTIQCERPDIYDYPDVVIGEWETVCVTNELRGQVWISPDLFSVNYGGVRPTRPSAKKPSRSVESRKDDVLKFRILITVGFYEFDSNEYSKSPRLVKPRREERFRDGRSEEQCPDDFQYDDGTSLIDDYTPA